MEDKSEGKCPVMHGAMTRNSASGTANQDWWPDQLNLNILHQHEKSLIRWEKTLTTDRSLKKLIILL